MRDRPCLIRGISLVLLFVPILPAAPIQILITTGGTGWTVSTTGDPTIAGMDFSTATYTSGTGQTVLRINELPGGWMGGGTGWIVYVRKTDTSWNSNLGLWIRRTNGGQPAGNLSGGPGLNVYMQVTNTDQELFRCVTQTEVRNIRCQLEIRGVSARYLITPSNVTSVIYTVTEY